MNTKKPSKILRLSPMMPSTNLIETKAFLIKALNFDVVMDAPDYVVLTKDGYDIHLCPAGELPAVMSVYLEVDDLDTTWQGVKSELTENINVREPFERDYGMREFHVGIRQTNTLLFVGQRV